VSKEKPRNVSASVRDRLMSLARQQREDFQFVLTRYVIERFLYRLSRSSHRDEFVLKGAMLFRLWTQEPHRPTRDLDLLGRGDPSLEAVAQVFRSVCAQAVDDDGVVFEPEAVTTMRIKEDQEYEGVRIRCRARLGQARIDLQVDVGFGDVVVPRAAKVTYPVMLEFPAPVLQAYPMPVVVAEKFQAMVALGIANSRMKDFYDLWLLARRFTFVGPALCRAIRATFRRRNTVLSSDPPLALTAGFGTDTDKVKQWQAFVKKGKLDVGGASLEQVCGLLNSFLMPPVQAIVAGDQFDQTWVPAGPWSANNVS
jgi:predicted nucleotidyltransferase component of viral defense system